MVFVALVGIVVGTETFTLGIVVVIGGATSPSMTLDAKVVVALAGELTPTRPRLEHSLGKGYAGWDMIFQHLLDGDVLILVNICLIGRIPLLADTVRDYMKKYPGIKLKIYCRSMENLMEMLEHGQLDVALSYKPLQSYDDIDSHILFNSNLCVIAGKDNPVAKKERIRLAELENLPLVLPAKGLQARNAFDSLLYGQNFKFDVRLEINDLSMLLDMVSRTNLVTLLSGATIHSNKNFVAISLDHPHSEMQGSFHLLKGTYCKNATKEFLKMLVENNSFLMAMEAIANR